MQEAADRRGEMHEQLLKSGMLAVQALFAAERECILLPVAEDRRGKQADSTEQCSVYFVPAHSARETDGDAKPAKIAKKAFGGKIDFCVPAA